jgi:hypothetical protein
VIDGALPPGFALGAATGLVEGTTSQVTPSIATIRLQDSAVSPQSGRPYRYDQELSFGPPACANTVDDDGDGKIDAQDSGCASSSDLSELNAADKCDDGLDNDFDGKVDAADPGCAIAPHDKESRQQACGLGAELAAIVWALARARRR